MRDPAKKDRIGRYQDSLIFNNECIYKNKNLYRKQLLSGNNFSESYDCERRKRGPVDEGKEKAEET